jgi:hypothetical protein
MTDDIVTRLIRLADRYKDGDREMLYADYETVCDSWSEIERLRELVGFQDGQLRQIRNAIYDEGVNPQHHRSVMYRHRKEWPTLWKAIDESMIENKKGEAWNSDS